MDKAHEGRGGNQGKGRSAVPSRDDLTVDEQLDALVPRLLELHKQISDVDFNRHRKHPDNNMSNAVSFLSLATNGLQKYLQERQRSELYGTEEVKPQKML